MPAVLIQQAKICFLHYWLREESPDRDFDLRLHRVRNVSQEVVPILFDDVRAADFVVTSNRDSHAEKFDCLVDPGRGLCVRRHRRKQGEMPNFHPIDVEGDVPPDLADQTPILILSSRASSHVRLQSVPIG